MLDARKVCFGCGDGLLWMRGKCALDAGKVCFGCGESVLWIQGKCALDVGKVCFGCGEGVLWMWGKCALDAETVCCGCGEGVLWMQGKCALDAGEVCFGCGENSSGSEGAKCAVGACLGMWGGKVSCGMSLLSTRYDPSPLPLIIELITSFVASSINPQGLNPVDRPVSSCSHVYGGGTRGMSVRKVEPTRCAKCVCDARVGAIAAKYAIAAR